MKGCQRRSKFWSIADFKIHAKFLAGRQLRTLRGVDRIVENSGEAVAI